MTDNDGADGPMQVDAGLVRQLAELLNEGDLSEIEVQDGKRRIVVKRKLAGAVTYAPAPIAQSTPAAAPAPALASAMEEPTLANAVTSPMVGTAYLSAEPGSKPFVAVGDRVSAGETLLIIEAMKVMNAIPATHAGVVRQILVQNAQPVEYDQPLVIIE